MGLAAWPCGSAGPTLIGSSSLARGLRSWGEALRAAGRADEAEPILRRSLALFDEMGLDAEANAVRAVLAIGETKLAFS